MLGLFKKKVKPTLVMGTLSAPQEKAHFIAQGLVEKRLCACAQVNGPISSIYWWKDQIEKDSEALIFIKTLASKEKEINQFLLEHHPYAVPEFILFPIIGGNDKYLEWMLKEVR
ncbi:MAG: divalent-cation tolerance protein CutA [Spirochaetales bacterium]|nr:divalent-cation tolerance protein CutA [Spirochaetales bacterium]